MAETDSAKARSVGIDPRRLAYFYSADIPQQLSFLCLCLSTGVCYQRPQYCGLRCGLLGGIMARTTHQLNAITVAGPKSRGLHHDGDGLYLRVTASGSRSWLLRYTLNGKTRDMGLGAYPRMSLAAARKEAIGCRELVGRKLDPIEARKAAQAAAKAAAGSAVSFRQCAESLIAVNESAWRNPKHRQQ